MILRTFELKVSVIFAKISQGLSATLHTPFLLFGTVFCNFYLNCFTSGM